MARGADRRRTFVDDFDYSRYLAMLGWVVRRQGWKLLCFCLMPNHVHHIIEAPETNLGNGMQLLHSQYALYFNERHCRVGHLFESPYKSPLITSEASFVRTVGYVVMNPVAAALSKRPTEWPWGSHRLVAESSCPHWLAHDGLEDRLEAITGERCYGDLVRTRERELMT